MHMHTKRLVKIHTLKPIHTVMSMAGRWSLISTPQQSAALSAQLAAYGGGWKLQKF